MSEDNPAREADHDRDGIFIGDGSAPNYPALLLFLAGGVLGGIAVYAVVNHNSNYIAFLIAALLCACIALVFIMMKKSSQR